MSSQIKTSYTASEARKNLYNLIKSASKGLISYEITSRGNEPVVLMSKAELESWQETFDILDSHEELGAIKKAMTQKKTISHKNMLKQIGLNQ